MKQASMANEACFISQRSLLRWASKLYSFFCVLLGNFGSNNIIHVAILNNDDLIAIGNFANSLILAIGMNARYACASNNL